MTDGERDGVRGVVRPRYRGKPADALDHLHDLLLLRPAVADHGLLDLQRRILVDLDPGLSAGQKDHAASMGNGNAGRDVGVETTGRLGLRGSDIDVLSLVAVVGEGAVFSPEEAVTVALPDSFSPLFPLSVMDDTETLSPYSLMAR